MAIINVQDVIKHYKQGSKIIKANDGISLMVNQGEFVAIIGASGSGKSTLLQLVSGLDRPDTGQLEVGGINLMHASEHEIIKLRRSQIGFVFQNFNLIPTLTAIQNVEAAINHHGKLDALRAQRALAHVGLAERADHLPALLSGGEQQRVAIARAIVNDPEIILADEPTGNLDSKTSEEILLLLRGLSKDRRKTLMVITHSDYVKRYADRIYEIKDGKLVV